MKLYHYNKEPLTSLKSKATLYGSDNDNPLDYNKPISFFLEPIPLLVAALYNQEHQFWKSGMELYEHVIDTSTLPSDFHYYLAETPDKTEMLYVKQDWSKTEANPSLIKKYIGEVHQMEVKKGYRGVGLTDFLKVAGKFNKGISDYYSKAYQLHKDNPDDGFIRKYAAGVPHAMLYFDVGVEIKIQTAKKIRIK